MATEFEIYINYVTAKRKADQLDQVAAKLRRMAENNIPNDLSVLKKNWTGTASGEYVKKANQLAGKMIDEARSLSKVAETIRNIANRTYNSEMEALRIARKRTYK